MFLSEFVFHANKPQCIETVRQKKNLARRATWAVGSPLDMGYARNSSCYVISYEDGVEWLSLTIVGQALRTLQSVGGCLAEDCIGVTRERPGCRHRSPSQLKHPAIALVKRNEHYIAVDPTVRDSTNPSDLLIHAHHRVYMPK
jgi:hypothetical protein